MTDNYSPLGLLSFLTFGFSIIAAVMAIDMYKLLRTGEFGRTWRLLIIACVMFALLQVLKMAEVLNFRAMRQFHLSEIVELCFVMALAYAFYQQRQLFTGQSKTSSGLEDGEEAEEEEDEYMDEYSAADSQHDETDETEETVAAHATQWPNVSELDSPDR